MTAKRILEVCAFTIQSCVIAERAGAARVELCDNPVEGGTTPSWGLIRQARERLSIALYPIIRPRAGNFLYDEEEIEIMRQDIRICRELGCEGISVGVSHIDSTINQDMMKRIVEWAGPMGVTCHRVFDGTPDPYEALEAVIASGCERILTSGMKAAAPDAGPLLRELVKQAGNRIVIMPGAGVKSGNIRRLAEETGATEFHSSARVIAPNPLTYVNREVSDYGNVYIADEAEVRAMVDNLDAVNSHPGT